LIPKECFKSIPPAFDAVYGPLRGHFGGGSEAGVLRAGGPAGHGRPGRPNFSQKFRRFSIREIGISSLSLSLSLISVICYLISLVYRAGGFVMIISLPPIPACPPWVRPAVRRPGKPNACRIPGRDRPGAGRREFPHRNDDSADPNAVPNGGRLGVNIASTFDKSRNQGVWVDLDFRLGRPRLSFG
jgi:hypothetical protein